MLPHRPEILIIESQSQSVAGLLRLLHGKAVDVMVALTVEDGFRKACDGQPDLILLNLDLPECAGIAAMQGLGAEIATAHIPVLAGSTRRALRYRREALRAGAVDYLVKPFRSKPLMARIFVHFNLPVESPGYRQALPASPSFFEVSSSHESQVVMQAIAALQQTILVWPGTVHLARQLGLGEADLVQAFAQQFGLTVEVFHWWLRLEWARAQLRSRQQSTLHIGQTLGCGTPGDFAQVFHKHYGLSPDDYRHLY